MLNYNLVINHFVNVKYHPQYNNRIFYINMQRRLLLLKVGSSFGWLSNFKLGEIYLILIHWPHLVSLSSWTVIQWVSGTIPAAGQDTHCLCWTAVSFCAISALLKTAIGLVNGTDSYHKYWGKQELSQGK